MKKITRLAVCAILACTTGKMFAQIPYDVANKKGRIIYFSDGNGGDIDDVGANAFTLLTLNKAGLKNKLKLFVYTDKFQANNSFGNHERVNRETIDRFINTLNYNSNVFKQGDHYAQHRTPIVNKIKSEVRLSTAANPLYIIFAGEGGYSYTHEAFDELTQNQKNNKLRHVTLISHSLFNEDAFEDRDNNVGSRILDEIFPNNPNYNDNTINLGGNSIPLFSWRDLERDYGQAKYFGHRDVLDQNGRGASAINGFATDALGTTQRWVPWAWMESGNASDNNTRFALDQMQERIVFNPDKIKNGKADISDFGMVWFMLTGNKKGNPYELRDFFRTGNLPKPFFITNQADPAGNKRKLGSNFELKPSDFATVRSTNGKMLKDRKGTMKMLGSAQQGSKVKWFKVPTDKANEFFIAHAQTGLVLVSQPGNVVQISNVDNDSAIWTQANNSIITNKGTGKEFRPNGNNITQVANGTGNRFKWAFTQTNAGLNAPIANNKLETIDFVSANNVDAFKVYPNPATSEISFTGVENGTYQVNIFSMLGAVVKTITVTVLNGVSSPISIESLEAGVLVLKVENELVSKSIRFIKK